MKRKISCCIFCKRFKEKREWGYENYNTIVKEIQRNKIKVIFKICKDCQSFDAIFATRARKFKKLV